MIGAYEMDIFGEVARSSEGYILIDFINGTFSGAEPSATLSKAISHYAQALEELCRKHGTKADTFVELKARYSVDAHGGRFVVTVADQNGKRCAADTLIEIL